MWKKLLGLLLILCCLHSCALADVQGFGKIGQDGVAVHEGMDGKVIYRLQKGHTVYVLSSKPDKEGNLWYRFITQVKQGGSLTVRKGWVTSEYIDLSDAVYTDVVSVSAGESGFLALLENGDVIGEANITSKIEHFYDRIATWQGASQVVAGNKTFAAVFSSGDTDAYGANTYGLAADGRRVRLTALGERRTLLFSDGTFASDRELEWVWPEKGADLRDAVQIAQRQQSLFVLFRDGTVGCLAGDDDRFYIYPEPFPDFSLWTGVKKIDTVLWHPNNVYYYEVFCALLEDGTVKMSPRRAEMLTDGWTDLVDIGLGSTYVVGIRSNGTALAAGRMESIIEDVAEWTDVVSVSCADNYCIGLKKDGTLVFAGDFEYDR